MATESRGWGRLLAVLAAALLVLGTWGLAEGQETGRTFVGRVAGFEAADVLVAVVVAPDGAAIAYLCSKDDNWNRENSKWFSGELNPQGQLTVRAADGTQLTAVLDVDKMEGSFGNLRWTAELVTSGEAGLYRGRAGDTTHAAIVAPDGTRVGRAWSIVTGSHVGTWDFSIATVQFTPSGLSAQQQQQFAQFGVVDMFACASPITCG